MTFSSVVFCALAATSRCGRPREDDDTTVVHPTRRAVVTLTGPGDLPGDDPDWWRHARVVQTGDPTRAGVPDVTSGAANIARVSGARARDRADGDEESYQHVDVYFFGASFGQSASAF